MGKSTIKINSELNVNLMIVSRLLSKSKEQLAEEFLSSCLAPYMDNINRIKVLRPKG